MNDCKSIKVIGADVTTYAIEGDYVTAKSNVDPFYNPRYEHFRRLPEVGEKYDFVWCGDYENANGGNCVVEVTAENRAEIAFHMNDPLNDIAEYILISEQDQNGPTCGPVSREGR